MMDQLINIGAELEFQLRDFFSGRQFRDSVRGVSIDIDNYWEHSELFSNQKRSRDFFPYYPFDYRDEVDGQDDFWQLIREYHKNTYHKTDFSYRPHDWHAYCEHMGYPENSGPILIRVTLKEKEYFQLGDLPRQFNQQYPIIYESRPQNKAIKSSSRWQWLSKGINWLRGIPENRAPAITRKRPWAHGTVGGMLQGIHSSRSYIVSCGHVMGDLGTSVYKQYNNIRKIGEVVYHFMPPLCDPRDPCSNTTDPQLQSIDVSVARLTVPDKELFDMGRVVMPNKIASISEIRKNDRVTFTGKVSGVVEAKIGALTLWDQINFADGTRCFGRIFEINPVNRQYVREELAKPGDSGSMVVLEINSIVKWYGLVVSCDGGKAYACFAEYIMDDCRKKFPEPLRCFS